MNKKVLEVNNLSKLYRLGEVGTGTLSHDLKRWWAKLRGKEDPFALVGQVNDRSKAAESDYVWALKDINFSVKQGEVLGIIGRNGAGKSTLLKLISQITSPTTGYIKAKGRIASLLEVGTGMNPELTAKENIYLNGAILGMTKKEIAAKFDEIVDFSGCTMYVDTPIKRFSSGMRVRLGFAVAAFLEPEILIVDEVLAVGDAEFQKKAIGKMKDISVGGGRTVLFVSHNMVSIQSLCTRAILMENGGVKFDGEVEGVIDEYMKINTESRKSEFSFDDPSLAPGNENVKILSLKISPKYPLLSENVFIEIEVLNTSEYDGLNVALDFVNNQEIIAFGTAVDLKVTQSNKITSRCVIPKHFLNDGLYTINCYVNSDSKAFLYALREAVSFEVKDEKRELGYLGKVNGVVRPILNWEIEK